MNDDTTLLRRYAEERSEAAFTELVRRHVDLVYSAALRRTHGDSHHAADVSQQVFTKLAREADKMSRHSVLSAWLYTATRNAAINLMRSEQRRTRREQEAYMMDKLISDSESDTGWHRLRPALDAMMDQLSQADRTAVILRFFEKRPFVEIGAALNLTENTARMRTDRALDKLRALLARRGVTSTSAALAIALETQAATAAPAGFAASLTDAALAGVSGSGAGSTALQLFLAMNKIKIGIASGLLVAGMMTALVEIRANRALSAEINTLQAPIQDPVIAARKLSGKNLEINELLLLRNRIAQLKARPEGVVDSEMKSRAEWRNVGRATPAAALETIWWGFAVKDMSAIADSIAYNNSDKAVLDNWFAGLSETVRDKYGTPERLIAPLAREMSDGTSDQVVAYQVIDQQNDHGADTVKITYWERFASGKEHQAKIGLTQAKDGIGGWRFSPSGTGMSESQWKTMVFSQINPATGEIIAPSR